MIYCKELDKNFESKTELFKALREAKETIIASKKAVVYNCKSEDNKGGIPVKIIDAQKLQAQCKGLDIDDDYYYIAVNTTLILDHHEDLHVNGIWNKSAKDQQKKVYLLWDHELKGTMTIVRKEHIEMFVANISWSLLGRTYAGETEALIYKFRKDKVIDERAKEWLDSGDEIQASVRMRYITILFALNSDEREDKEFKKNYNKYIGLIANKDDFKEILYFWAVLEAANVYESSLVPFGSNSVTGQVKISEPPLGTPNKEEPLQNTLTVEEFRELVKGNLFKN